MNPCSFRRGFVSFFTRSVGQMPSDAVKNRWSVVASALQFRKVALSRVACEGILGTNDHGSQITISDASWLRQPRKTTFVGFGFAALATQDTSISLSVEIPSTGSSGVFNSGSFIPSVPSGDGDS